MTKTNSRHDIFSVTRRGLGVTALCIALLLILLSCGGKAAESKSSNGAVAGEAHDTTEWFPRQFAATVRYEDPEDPETSGTMRQYVGNRRIRMESDHGGMSGAMIMIFEGHQIRILNLNHDNKQYYEVVSATDEESAVEWQTIMIPPDNAQHPCQTEAQAECEQVGTETILGRRTEEWRYRFADAQGDIEEGTMWYDPDLRYALRVRDADGTSTETTEIVVGRQPVSLFEVPDGYQKMDLGY